VWETTLHTNFPGAITVQDFVTQTYSIVHGYGFTSNNTLPCVCLCRDEICSTLSDAINTQWESKITDLSDHDSIYHSRSFVFSSLAGMLNLGKTGLKAALGHSPVDYTGRRRYAFFVFPHVGISSTGVIGQVERVGIKDTDAACGALSLFRDDVISGKLNVTFDPSDAEYSMVKIKLAPKLKLINAQQPSIKDITEITYQTILEDLSDLLSLIDYSKSDIAVFTGIQIHSPHHVTYVQPRNMYSMVNGQILPVDFTTTHHYHQRHHSPHVHHSVTHNH